MSEEQRKVFDQLMGAEYSKYYYDHFLAVRKKVKDRITASLDESGYVSRGGLCLHHIQKKPTISDFEGDMMNVLHLSDGKLKKVNTNTIHGQLKGSMKSIPLSLRHREFLKWNYHISKRMDSEFMLFATYVEVFYGWRRYIPLNDGPHYVVIFNIWEFDDKDIDNIISMRMYLWNFWNNIMPKNITDIISSHANKEMPVARGLVHPYIWNIN